jgi:uncharacterized protein YdeI (YjbR/CyaY-like superfamily)
MQRGKRLYVTDREKWRAWLEKNHDVAREIWLIYYKKHTGKDRIPYDDAVEEALCFGWIDSTVRRLDDERYMQKYTPRKTKSVWSKLNKRRAQKMIRRGRMTGAGLARIRDAKASGEWARAEERSASSRQAVQVPTELRKALAGNRKAREYFETLAPSYRRQYIGWLMSAKRDDTRKRRLKEIVLRLAQNKKLGMR